MSEPVSRVKALGAILSCAVALVVAIELRAVQFATPHMLSRDGYYHARYANLLPSRGLSREFAWTQFSFWKNHFSDKEVLFHAWLVPFCRDETTMVAHAKFAAWLLAGAVIAAFGFAMRYTGVRAPPVWALALAGSGSHFLYRLCECRAHVLSIGFFIAGTALLLKGKWKWLAVCGFLYAWSYAAPHMLVAIAMAHAAAMWIHEGKREWRGVAAAAVGVFAGLVIHPYSPNSLHMWWVQNVVVLQQTWGGASSGLTWGDEFDAVPTRSLVFESTGVFISMIAGTILSVVSARRQLLSARTFSLLFIALACFGLYCLSGRFIEYFAPAAVWLVASAVSDLVDADKLSGWWKTRPGAVAWGAALAVALLGATHWRTIDRSVEESRRCKGPVLAGAARWTRAHLPAGANVGHLNWGDFVQLFAYDPDHHFINGLDPAFMLVTDPARIRYWEEVRTGRQPLDPEEFAATFDTEVLIVTKEVPRQVRMCEDALLERLFEDEKSIVYSLKSPVQKAD
ncbi:MAG: hypothetical protein K8T20_13350 [Planctomycetes bacterium]|nr:hypothetical protein [Planctomycetota bacterium]